MWRKLDARHGGAAGCDDGGVIVGDWARNGTEQHIIGSRWSCWD